MKITFFRKGFANNSSSSHSIIFTKDDLSGFDSDTTDFGRYDFVASLPQTKYTYFLICLYNSWICQSGLESESDMVDTGELSECYVRLFCKWLVDNEIGGKKNLTEKDVQTISNLVLGGSVDHESMFYFPLDRQGHKSLNVEFIKFFFKEVCRPEYVILGGSDGSVHELQKHDTTDNDAEAVIKILYEQFRSYGSIDTICVYDSKTKEFVISSNESGNLLKIEVNL